MFVEDNDRYMYARNENIHVRLHKSKVDKHFIDKQTIRVREQTRKTKTARTHLKV